MNNTGTKQKYLKARLNEITELVDVGSPIAYLDYPVHGNFGDLLIFLGTLEFLGDHGCRIESCHSLHWLPKRLPPNAVVLMQGGGNFGDLYPHHQSYRNAAIARFGNHRIIILPQTIHFQHDSEIRRVRQVLEAHPDLHILLRDFRSLELAKRHFPDCKSRLLPDMAHYLWPGPLVSTAPAENARSPLFLMRDDKETGRVFPELDVHSAGFRDWSAFYTRGEARQIQLSKTLHRLNGKLHGRLPLAPLWILLCKGMYRHLAQELSGHGTWITSRLHGAIFGTLLGKRIGLLDNSYGKNKRYFNTWAEHLNDVAFLQSPGHLRNFL